MGKKQDIAKHSLQCVQRANEKKSTKSFNHLFFSTFTMTFLKTEKICSSDIMGQNWYSYNAKFTNPNCLVKNSYSIRLGIQLAKSIEKIWSANNNNKLIALHAECTYALCQSIYLSIYKSLDMYTSISLSIINKTVLLPAWAVEALAKTKYTLFRKWCHFMVNICFNWHFFVTSKVYIKTIKWHNFQSEHRWRLRKNREVIHSENYVVLLRDIDFDFLSLYILYINIYKLLYKLLHI